MIEPLVISVEEAARMLSISRGLAYEAARRGELPTIRLGRRLLVPRRALLELCGATDFGNNGHASPDREEVDASTRQAETFAGTARPRFAPRPRHHSKHVPKEDR
jgi:excisionase family DNA binding protein